METRTPVRVVHYFDTQSHQILCEPQSSDYHSTKHARGVTCPACVKLLAAKSANVEGAAEPASQTTL